MTWSLFRVGAVSTIALCGIGVASCGDDDLSGPDETSTRVVLQNRSVTPALVRSLITGVDIYSVIGSDDVLPNSPTFRFGGSADGAGLLKNGDGTFTAL